MTTATPRPVPGPPKPAPPPATRAEPGRTDGARIEETPVTGAQSLVRALEEAGCEVVFGIPGGAILPAYDPLLDSTKVRHVLVRHEQGAGHAATGYAQANGRVGVCMATSGPGATNLITPLADAHMDSVPIVAITGQVARAADRHGRVPGGRHHRHHHAGDQAQHAGDRRRGDPAGDRRGVPPGVDGPTGPGAGGHLQGRAAGEDHLRPGPRSCACPATGRRPGRTASRSARPPS